MRLKIIVFLSTQWAPSYEEWYSAEEALQVLWAAQVFHPDLFKDLDMVEKTQAFYKKYYNYDLSKENAQQILQGLPPLK